MSNSRSDQLAAVLVNLDRRTNQEDDPEAKAQNMLIDRFVPFVETLTFADTLEARYFSGALCWGGTYAVEVAASSPGDWGERTNVVL